MINNKEIERLFKAHFVSMQDMAIAILHDDDIARDIVHEVFASLLNSPPSIPVTLSYLLKAVRNKSLNYIRDLDIHRRIKNMYLLETDDYDSENWPDEETIARIYEVIKTDLTPQAERVIKLRFREGKRFSKIAEEMGISETAVYRHLNHALVKIRHKISDQNG